MRLKVDATRWSAVVVCECGWRAGAGDRPEALRLAAQHERQCHPLDNHARTLLGACRG